MSKSFAKARQDGYMPIKDFATLAHVSNQAVYLKIKNNAIFAEKYTAVIENRRMIHESALEEYGVKPKQEEPEESKSQDESTKLLIETLQRANEALQKELEAKNLQIARLEEALINQQKLSLLDKKADPVGTESTTADVSNTDNHVVHADSVSAENTVDRSTVKRKSFFSRFLRS